MSLLLILNRTLCDGLQRLGAQKVLNEQSQKLSLTEGTASMGVLSVVNVERKGRKTDGFESRM